MQSVVHFSINSKEGEGVELSKQYKIGSLFPVFILANSSGDVIYRWTGYTDSNHFTKSLGIGLRYHTTVDERKARLQTNPSFPDAIFLASYSSETGEHLKAVEYYRQAGSLVTGGSSDYSYEIFENTAKAAWKDMIAFDDVLPAADGVLSSRRGRSGNIAKMTRLMIKLARKQDKTDRIAKYIQAGVDATADDRSASGRESHMIFQADFELYVNHDTVEAVRIKKSSMGDNWLANPEKYYGYSKWGLERKIILEEAEHYAREALKRAYAGEFRAQVLNTLAEICYALGDLAEAIRTMELAIEQDPEKNSYKEKLERFQGESGG
jgi:tetratricopeptide (TPR) repeat protein